MTDFHLNERKMKLSKRLWLYQVERFPLFKTVPLLAVFSAASITISAVLADRAVPGFGAYVTGFCLAFLVFFQMRVADEIKDVEDDRLFRPERAIPRGIVTLRLIVTLGVGTLFLAIIIALLYGAGLIWLLLLVWLWLFLMTLEFGVPRWLKARPIAYLLSHMAIMPLLDIMLTGIEWLPHGGPHPALWLFIALSFVNGCLLEIGRKMLAPQSERVGVETYSGLWGPAQVSLIWQGLLALSTVLLIGVGIATGDFIAVTILALIGAGLAAFVARAYGADPSKTNEKRIDAAAGLWVFFCYATAGFVPLIL
ncbi:UbiA family prenyltransferase [Yoonia sp. 208BN28-4]|uniref:UbiA family prenyltransferase n=1 Tax=Yoonia sp. 208BN28-4 TaxID=3126505 RepID=UPI00309DDEF9